MIKLFWAQNKNSSLANTVIDSKGSVIQFHKSNEIAVKIVDDLLEYQEVSKLKVHRNNLYLRINPYGGVFVSSNFSNKDDSGRKMAFMFFTENTNSKDVIQDLVFFGGLINRDLQEEDLTTIKKELNNNIIKSKKLILTPMIIFMVVLIIYMLWKKMS